MERIILTASDGMIYTDGVSGGKVIYLAEGQTSDGWYEVPEADYIAAVESGLTVGEATAEDYQSALAEFGVDV